MQPSIIIDAHTTGWHSTNGSAERVIAEGLYKDSSTVCVVPTRGMIPWRVVQSWMGMATPMNQKFVRMGVVGHEVGAAYSQAVQHILDNPGLADFQFMLTLEEDNMPPADGLLKLVAAMHEHPEYAAIGGLYWTKGEGGQPMIYGNPTDVPLNFRPQPPVSDGLVECNGLGMGFTLFRLSMFKDERLERPWFQTVQRYEPNGAKAYTQDLFFFENARKAGYRFACDCRVGVGHYDVNTDIVW